MATIEFKGNSFSVDEDGFIDDFNSWNRDWVDYVKESEGIKELTEEHWKIINILQDYYKKNGIAPMVRILSKVTGFKLKSWPPRSGWPWYSRGSGPPGP